MNPSRSTSPSRYTKATHLTEFYPYLNGGSPSSAQVTHSRQPSVSATIQTTSTTNTLQSILTKNDIQKTSLVYNEILETCEDYRQSLSKVVETSANFGNALEKLTKLKGTDEVNEDLLNVSGFFYLISNHQEILNQSIKNFFEIPINKEVNNFNLKISSNDENFKLRFKKLLKELKVKEAENSKLSKSKKKDLNTYKSKLLQLTSHLDSIEQLKQQYYQESFELVESSNKKILNQLGTIIRAQVEIYENIAKKGWSGGGLDELIAQCSDPFSYDDEESEVDEEREEARDDDDNETIEDDTMKKELTSPFSSIRKDSDQISTNQSLAKDHEGKLNHKQSIRTLDQEYLNDTSTPLKSPLKSPTKSTSTKSSKKSSIKSPRNSDSKNEPAPTSTSDDDHGDLTNTSKLLALTIDDDNSFSLPIPGSSSRIESKDDTPNGEQDVREILDYEGHKEWS